MKKLLLLLSALISTLIPAFGDDEEGIRWLSSYKEALQEARETGKPIFLEFRCEA